MSRRDELQAKFEEFDKANPRIWWLFNIFAQQAINAGRTRCGAKLIIERIRWEVYVVTKSEDDFKICNNHTAYYARKWLAQHRNYPDFFQLRENQGRVPMLNTSHYEFVQEDLL